MKSRKNISRIFVRAQNAAWLLDMPKTEFLALVTGGHLPGPSVIAPGVERWEVGLLQRVGLAEINSGGMEW